MSAILMARFELLLTDLSTSCSIAGGFVGKTTGFQDISEIGSTSRLDNISGKLGCHFEGLFFLGDPISVS